MQVAKENTESEQNFSLLIIQLIHECLIARLSLFHSVLVFRVIFYHSNFHNIPTQSFNRI